MKRRILIDTDPGQDDAVALLLALAAPDVLDVRAITTVAGNVPLALTTRNALAIVELAGRTDVPVFAGCARPMVNEPFTAEYVHGPTGLDGADLPTPSRAPAAGHAVDRIIDLLREEDGVTVCTLGPLTNLAMALVKAPDIAPRIERIVMMGGGFFEGGNVTPAAEFNIYVDPHAAHVVFTSGAPITMLPLDVTHKAIATQTRVQAFADLGTPAGRCVAGMLSFFERHDTARYGSAGAPLHDPCVPAWLLHPELFDGKNCSVEIETSPGATQGMTLVDWWGTTGRDANAMVCNEVDADGFFDLLLRRIRQI